MSELTFTREEAWTGGEYELAILLRPADDDVLGRALVALWAFPDLEGCYLVRDVEPQAQARVNAATMPFETVYGTEVRMTTRRDSSALVFLTSDGWDT